MIYASITIYIFQLSLALAIHNQWARYFFALTSIVIATISAQNFSKDSKVYKDAYSNYGQTGFDQILIEAGMIEPSFLLIAKTLNTIGAPATALFLTFIIPSIIIKTRLILNHSTAPAYSLAFFISYFFILHDSTQIRASLAIALLFLALTYLANGYKLRFALITLATAITIHASSIVFLVMLLMKGKVGTIIASLSMLVGVLVFITHAESLSMINLVASLTPFSETIIQNKLNIYIADRDEAAAVNPFNIMAITAYIGIILTALQYRKFNDFEMLCFNATLLSIAVLTAFWDLTTIQLRVSEIFAFGFVFTIPYLIKSINSLTLNTNPTAVNVGILGFLIFLHLYFTHYKQMVTT